MMYVEEFISFFKEMVPTQVQIEWGAVVSFIGTAFSYACGWGGAIEALVCAMAIDYVSGVLAAYLYSCSSNDRTFFCVGCPAPACRTSSITWSRWTRRMSTNIIEWRR